MAGKPEKRFKNDSVEAVVWNNVSKTGDNFKTVSLTRSYRKNNEWRNTNSFGVNDIDKAIDVLKQARDYLLGSNPP